MTRFFACLALLSCATPAFAAQRNERQRDADEVTVRGCLHDPLELWSNDQQRQPPESQNWTVKGQRFALIGDSDVLNQLGDHVRHEIEVTGLIEIPRGSPAIVESPRGRGGTFPGLPPTGGFGRPSPGAPRATVYPDRNDVSDFLVTDFEHVSLECRQ
jgi:hypothetical protein